MLDLQLQTELFVFFTKCPVSWTTCALVFQVLLQEPLRVHLGQSEETGADIQRALLSGHRGHAWVSHRYKHKCTFSNTQPDDNSGPRPGGWTGKEEETGQGKKGGKENANVEFSTERPPVCFVLSDFAEKRLKLAEILYYKILENVMVQELKRLQGKDMSVGSSLPDGVPPLPLRYQTCLLGDD